MYAFSARLASFETHLTMLLRMRVVIVADDSANPEISPGHAVNLGPDTFGRQTFFPEGAQGLVLVAFGQPPARLVTHEGVMKIFRGIEAEQRLKDPLDMGRLAQVLAAYDMRDGLQMVIKNHGDMIGRRDVLAGKNDVAEKAGIDFKDPFLFRGERDQFLKVKRQCAAGLQMLNSLFSVEAQGEGLSGPRSGLALIVTEGAASTRIMRSVRPMGGAHSRFDFGGDVLAGAEAGIGEALVCEAFDYCLVFIKVLRLTAHWLLPLQAKPAKVFQDRCIKLGPTARQINILDAQNEGPAARPGKIIGGERRISVPRMEKAGGARCKAGAY